MPVPTAYERRFVLRLDISRAGNTARAGSSGEAGEADSGWGFTLDESIGGRSDPLAAVPVSRACRYRRAVLEAVTTSGYTAAAVSRRRRRPFNLACEPGVRLALLTLACEPVRKPGRRQAIAHGIQAMTTEETLYWYALIRGQTGPRALRALRTLLAD